MPSPDPSSVASLEKSSTRHGAARRGGARSAVAQLRSPSRARRVADYLAVLVVAVAPMLWSRPGVVTDDTKTYLYLDPGRYVRAAASMWDPSVALGTVTHENIGYLLPMGPFYWAMAELHVPLWIAQRLWMGAILFAAGAGVLALCRVLGLWGPGRYVAVVAFMLTPYVLQYAGRISVILLPWSGLPWMLAFTILAARRGGWRYPALFGLVVILVSGINASSILYVGLAPALWLPWAAGVSREISWRQAWAAAWRIAVLTVGVSLWWAAGLQVEAAYGINILKYTETVPATSSTSTAAEVIRGLGYWYFYGSDRVGQWTQASVAYTQQVWLVALSYAVPVLAFAAAALLRWAHRSYFVLLALLGTVLSVGAFPYAHPTWVGSALKAFMVDTTAGLAMRSTDRVTPLVVLSLALLLGAGVSALAHRFRRAGLLLAAVAGGAAVGAATPLLTGAVVANGFTQPATPPASVRSAARALQAQGTSTRVYALPGNNFAAYRCGDTIDTVYPGLMTRPFVTHEQQIMGSMATADLLYALDSPLQNEANNWNAVGPMASLMSAGSVLVQYDQAYERYFLPQPQAVAAGLATTPVGLSDPTSFGTPVPNVSTIAKLDESTLSRPANAAWPAPLVTYKVAGPRPVVRAESLADPLVVDGGGSGVVDAAPTGLLAGHPTILYAGTLDLHPRLRASVLSGTANLVVTDTNRKQAFEWNSLSENTGYTETASQPPSKNPADAPIDLFPGAPADAKTTAVFDGISSVTASSYGSSLTYLPEDQPAAALDGNLQTAWLDNSFATPTGQWWQVVLDHRATPGSITLVQPQTGLPDRYITSVVLTFDGGHPLRVKLGPASRAPAGQRIPLGNRSFSTLRITIAGFRLTAHHNKPGFQSSVGFAEVHIPGVHADETIAMPQDLLRAAGARSLADTLTFLMTRQRMSGFPPRSSPEPVLSRQFWLPTARTFSLSGTARISPLIPDDAIDRLVGRPGSHGSGIVAYSKGRLPGDLRAGAIATLDGSSRTVWEPGFGASQQPGNWLEYRLPHPITVDHLDLQVVADGEHSVPTTMTVSAGGVTRSITLPSIADGRTPGTVVDVPVSFPAVTGSAVRLTFPTVRIENTVDYWSESPIGLPIGIAEVGIPGLHAAPVPAHMPGACQSNLLTVDGHPVSVRVTGSTTAALDRQGLAVSLCGPDAHGITLGPGTHTVVAALGSHTGFNIDTLALESAAGGGAAALPKPAAPSVTTVLAPAATPAAPTVTVSHPGKTSMQLQVHGVTAQSAPFLLVLGESLNKGWTATVPGASGLGAPLLVDTFANGWRVDPARLAGAIHGGTLTVDLVWTPQARVDVALVASLAFLLLCLVLGFVPTRLEPIGAAGESAAVESALGADGMTAEETRTRRERRRHRWRDRWRTRRDRWRTRRLERRQRAGYVGPSEAVAVEWPRPVLPFRRTARRVGVPTAVAVALLTGAAASAVGSPRVGPFVAAGVLLALVLPRLRPLLGLAAAGCVAGAATWIVISQARHPFTAVGLWALHYAPAATVVLAGLALLAADAVADEVHRRRSLAPRTPRTRRRGAGRG